MVRRTIFAWALLVLTIGLLAAADTYRVVAWDVRALLGTPDGMDRLGAYLGGVDAQFIHMSGIAPAIAPALNGLLSLQGGRSVAALSVVPPLREGIFTPEVRVPIATSTVRCAGIDEAGFVSSGSNYWLELSLGKIQAAVIGVEFMPRTSDCRDDLLREGEAEAIRLSALLRIGHIGELILLGAVNDVDGDVRDAGDHEPVTDVLRLLKDPDVTMCGVELSNVCDLLPQAERYTAIVEGCPVQWDYILVSRVLRSMVKRVWIDREAPTVLGAERWPVFLDLEVCPASTGS